MTIFANSNYGWAEQDKNALLDYTQDWSGFLTSGDGIANSTWAADSADITLRDAAVAGGTTTIWVTGGVGGKVYRISNTVTTIQGRRDVRYFVVSITDGSATSTKPISTALFQRFSAVKQFKDESLAFLDRSFPVDKLTDDYIWESLQVAETEASHFLRCFFEPTIVVSDGVAQAEVDALIAEGKKVVREAPYDYDPSCWVANSWGHMIVRKPPIIELSWVRFSFPNPTSDVLKVPSSWLRVDKKYGQIRFVPTGDLMGLGPMSTYIMTAIASGRIIPGMISLRYTSGLQDVETNYPDLISVVKRMAIMRILKNAFLPQSGSISADGLSQSTSIDIDKWQDSIDRDLKKLQDTIHGIRFGVL